MQDKENENEEGLFDMAIGKAIGISDGYLQQNTVE